MPLATNLQTQDYRYQFQVLQGFWRWTTRLDVSQAAPAFSIRDIISPFGPLRDAVPIPGVVVQAMAQSIVDLTESFAPNILLDVATLTFTVDEGRGVSASQIINITNNGVYGSLLAVSLTTSAVYVKATPSIVGGISSTETSASNITVDSTDLLAVDSPLGATVIVQDPSAGNNPQTVALTIVVRPKAHIVLFPETLDFQVIKPISGSFPEIPTQIFTITNTGDSGSLLEYEIQKLIGCSDCWLVSWTPTSGSLVGGDSQDVTVTVVPADNLLPGVYTDTFRVSGYSDNFYQDVVVTLTIT